MDLSLLQEPLWRALLDLLVGYLRWSREGPRVLAEREQRLLDLSEALCRLLLASDAEADELAVWPGPCTCGGRFQSRGRRPRTLVTTVGEVTYRRRYYECETCKAHCQPVDTAWGVTGGCLSTRAKALAVDLASALPFREAQRWLGELGRVRISLSTLWRATQAAGAERVAAWTDHQRAMQSRKGAAAFMRRLRGPGGEGRWAIGVDGLMLRIDRQWREVKVAVIARLSETGQWQRGTMSYLASTAEAEEFRQQVVWHALARGITRRSVLALLSDGAAWIGVLATRHFPNALVIRDWWHVVEYLWKAAHALYGEETPEAQEQVDRWQLRLKEGKVGVIRRHLRWLKARRGLPDAQRAEAYRKTEGYLAQHAGAMEYGRYRAAKWPIGSGPAEATCKMIQVRMKRPGANWSRTGAQHLLFLRADYCSRLFATLHPQP
jgi:hypothetical protein